MARRRSSKRGPSPCPRCDAPLEAPGEDLDGEVGAFPVSATTCPRCGTHLIPIQVAGFWRRAGAAAIDLLILVPTAGLLNWGILALVDAPPLSDAKGIGALLDILAADPRTVIGRFAGFFAMATLYAVTFWGLMGRTPGGRVMGLRIIDQHARPVGVARACLRVLFLGLGTVPGGLGLLWAAFDEDKRAFHDHWASTYVVREHHR